MSHYFNVFSFNISQIKSQNKTKKIGISLTAFLFGDIFTGTSNIATWAPKQLGHQGINIALA